MKPPKYFVDLEFQEVTGPVSKLYIVLKVFVV
jgi:hypothetical protein